MPMFIIIVVKCGSAPYAPTPEHMVDLFFRRFATETLVIVVHRAVVEQQELDGIHLKQLGDHS